VHDVQLQPAGAIPVTAHDFSVDVIVTPTQVLRPARPGRRRLPKLDWRALSDEKIAAIPLLAAMQRDRLDKDERSG